MMIILWAFLYAFALPTGVTGKVPHSQSVSGVAFHTFSSIRADAVELPLVGWGVREKSLRLFSVNVYAAVLYGSKFGHPRALQMIFVRDVDKDKIEAAYRESLQGNGVSVSQEPMQRLLARLTRDAAKADETLLLAHSPDRMTVFDKSGTDMFKGPNLAADFFKIWLGNPQDKGLENLKSQLLNDKKS